MKYDQNFIEKVKDANNIVEIIGQYTELKARNHQYTGLCPFPDHNEKTPSFSVSESKQLYHCFGCKKSGNIFTFLEAYNGLSFVEALEYLAARAHIQMPREQGKQEYRKQGFSGNQKQQMFQANKLAALFYHQKLKDLPRQHKLHTYLKKRHLTLELIQEFCIGYAPESWDELTHHLKDKKVPNNLAEQLGLIRKNTKGDYFDLFRDRLIFPISSIDSNVTGFGARIIDQGQPKYINSIESDVFKKRQSFYGLNCSAKFIKSENEVFVVEGYMDLLALYSQGIRNVVATLGTALTEEHVRLLKRWTKNVVLLFDGDQAGQNAAQRSLTHFFKQDIPPKILILPEGMDPDDFIHGFGKKTFLEKAEKAEDLLLSQAKTLLADGKNQPANRIQFLDTISPILKSIRDPRLLQMYVEELAFLLNENPQKLHSWIMTGKRKTREIRANSAQNPLSPPDSTSQISLEGATEDELVLLGLSLKSLKYMGFFVNQQGLQYLNHEGLKKVFSQAVNKYGQKTENFDRLASSVLLQIKNPEKLINLVHLSSEDDNSNQDENLLKECFIRVKDRYLLEKSSVLVTEMKSSDLSDTKLERFMNLQNERKALKNLKTIPLEND